MIALLGSVTGLMPFVLAQDDAEAAGAAIGALCGMVIYFGIIILMIAGMWKAFVKAGKPGWAAIIPIYNMVVILEIVGRPIWWIVLLLIPCVNIVVLIMLLMDVAKAYGKGGGFGIGLAFLPFIFWPLLGFGDARYRGPVASPN